MTEVILVDENDQAIGHADKWLAHKNGLLHRAFSIFIFKREAGQSLVLLQQRKSSKYHSGGLWSNACCSHPLPDEEIRQAADRRLQQEMGFNVALQPLGQFYYRAPVGNGLIEHELDHVFIGFYSGQTIKPDPEEVEDYQWMELSQLLSAIEETPDAYTYWLKPALDVILRTNVIT